MAPLVKLATHEVEEVRRRKRSRYAYLACLADRCMVVDLEREMTVEKAVLLNSERIAAMYDNHREARVRRRHCTKTFAVRLSR